MNIFESDAKAVVDALSGFCDESVTRREPVINQQPMQRIIKELDLAGHVRKGDLRGDTLIHFVQTYLGFATRLHHPGYLAHQVATPDLTGSIASFIDGVTNNPMAIYEMGPGAAAIEFFVLNWMIDKIGWKPSPFAADDRGGPHAGGVLTHGGSLANLTALIAARSHALADVWENGSPGNLAVLAPPESHYSIGRAAGIMGIGRNAVIPLQTDARGVVIADLVPGTIQRARGEGKLPIAVVANACSTGAGLYDPLREIGKAAASAGLWFHVDGAHGATALLSEKYRSLLDGIELADSVIWDAHKLMRTPTLCAAVLVRDSRTLDAAFRQEASYLFHDKDQPGIDFIHRTVECTKAGLGLKFYAVLAAMGEQGLARYVEGRFDLAREAYSYIRGLPDFECAAEPQANIICFRLRGPDDLQMSVRAQVISEGKFYTSTVEIGGKRYLRAVFMNPHATIETVKELIDTIRETARTHL